MKTFFAILVFFPYITLSQIKIDRIKSEKKDESWPDSVSYQAVYKMIHDVYRNNRPESLFYLAQKGFELLNCSMLKKDIDEATNIHKLSFNKKEDFSNTLNNIGLIYFEQGNYACAFNYFNFSLSISKYMNDQSGIAQSLLNIALVFKNIGKFDKALAYNLCCLKICEDSGIKEIRAKCYNNIGMLFLQRKNYDKALDYYSQAYTILKESGNDLEIANTLGNIGLLYQLLGNFSDALKYQKHSLENYKKIGNKEGMACTYSKIGENFQNLGDDDSVIYYCNAAHKIAKEVGSSSIIKTSAKTLYNLYKSKNQDNKALAMFELYVEIKNNFQNKKVQNEINRQEFKYNYRQKFISDSLKDIQVLQLEKLAGQKASEKAKNQRFLLFAIFCALLSIIGIILRYRSIKIKAEKDFIIKKNRILKATALIYMASSEDYSLQEYIDRNKIKETLKASLNETDWNILSLLCNNPTINNRDISEKISMSFEGVRSSLKKMYRIFEIQSSNENPRVALVIKTILISNKI